ncbi:MAG: hypothetical protein IID08_07720 [Candidatus Hydrogenedentes bacterium]|nr:hypothetical protein [Candidatus Hydrogenedentota bacterium]
MSPRAEPKPHDVFIRPDLRRNRIAVTVHTDSPSEVRFSLNGSEIEAIAEKGSYTLETPGLALWSPGEPVIHTLRCTVSVENGDADTVDLQFGMRELTVRDTRFFLNQRPIHLRGVQYDSELRADEDPDLVGDRIRRELGMAKEAGFNFLRVEAGALLDPLVAEADVLGLLVFVDLSKLDTPSGKRAWDEIQSTITQYRNHPSVVAWHLPTVTPELGPGPDALDGLKQLRLIDPSRLLFESRVADRSDDPRFVRPYRNDPEPYVELWTHHHAPIDPETLSYIRNSGSEDRLTVFSTMASGDLGYLETAEAVEDTENLFSTLDMNRVFESIPKLIESSREAQGDATARLFNALTSNHGIAGYCYGPLVDGLHDRSGLLDRQGNPKPAFTRAGGFQREFRATVRLQRTSVRVRDEIRVRVEIINRGKIDGRGDLSLQVVGPTNQVLWKKKRGVKIPAHNRELWEGTISASGSPGRHTFVAKVFAESGPIAEGSMDFFVYPATSPYVRDICILDPDHRWTARCRALTADVSLTAPVHVVPSLANTIRAYPDNDLAHVMGQVRQGAVALIFGPPDDWNAFADLIGTELRATSRLTAGTRVPCFHYIRSHPVFDGLPTRGLMRQEYRYVYPVKTFDEHSDEDICGTINGGPKTDDTPSQWGTDILVRKYGEGRLVFTHLRILEHLGEDPVADRIFVNMLNHFSRRSVPSRGTVPIHQPSVEWLRRERSERVHRWTVIGVFANQEDKGLDTVYPPEQELNFDATYPGWYDVAIWKPWYSTEETGHRIDLQDAFSPPYQAGPRCDYGTGYAYAELHSEARATIALRIGVRNAMRVWLNGSILYESREATTEGGLRIEECACSLKQGRNTILVKVAKVPGPFEFSMDSITDPDQPRVVWSK